ncbi:hypothetical protein VDP25_17280 [Winogradskyella sp. ECml5-4]|uniref:hypothetical protein n=1 Tax=Winogradskyella sp. ECml5-4 TaxID=3110975 RepID=UPI002FF3EF90
MTIEEIKKIAQPYVEEPVYSFEIEKELFEDPNGRANYNLKIKENVQNVFGVYVWVDNLTNQIIYIGMAGKIKNNGELGSHSIKNRLTASRGKDRLTKKDILTNDYVKDFMQTENINSLSFYIMISKKEEPPAFIEALLLYKYYKKEKRLPKLNNSF